MDVRTRNREILAAAAENLREPQDHPRADPYLYRPYGSPWDYNAEL